MRLLFRAFPGIRLTPAALAAGVWALLVVPAIGVAPARAATRDRLEIDGGWALGVDRFQSLGADTLGILVGHGYRPELDVDFRVLDLPFGKLARPPALHLGSRLYSDELTLGPPLPGMLVGRYAVLGTGASVWLDLPLELVKGNSGVSFRLGWDGENLLSRSGPNQFLAASMLRFGFVRTGGGLQGSSILVGKGRDERYGYDAASGRWDVRLTLQARLVTGSAPAAPAARPGAKPAPKPAAPDDRLVWLFLEAGMNTDGALGADGMYGRLGVQMDLGGALRSAFGLARP